MSIKHLSIAAVLLMAGHSVAAAQSCEKNFKASGVPLVTPVFYKTWQEFPKLKPEAALQRMARGVAAEGFSGIEINKSLGTIRPIRIPPAPDGCRRCASLPASAVQARGLMRCSIFRWGR